MRHGCPFTHRQLLRSRDGILHLRCKNDSYNNDYKIAACMRDFITYDIAVGSLKVTSDPVDEMTCLRCLLHRY